ncbi:response regulator transcription factor [Lachnotalea glycerini]|uniref:Stage 0 sporulation protein A homolog n=1 Tax=Lachnotalea glycerini TaxID=1763509 RepID=A0A371J9F4_9FIRM|nr:response regulator transcription factor [Lachnotalea glycerini]RDY29317.1 DNA-binding response regulator [Lachnotalea glycerini]
MKYTILVIDDDKNICEIVKECMDEECYDFDIAYDGETGLQMLKSKSYHLVILDVMLPGINGYHVLDKIRQTSTIPVLMFTAKSENKDKVRGLKSGADDYFTKPFCIEELSARMESLIRRYTVLNEHGTEDEDFIYLKDMVINTKEHKVFVREKEVYLTAKEFDLLYFLASNHGRIFTKIQLYNQIWDNDEGFDTNNFMSFISKLRKKIESNSQFVYIQNIRGLGYRINTEVLIK